MGEKRVLVGMSGGVDSSVAADVLRAQGYDVTGCILDFGNGQQGEKDQQDARAVSRQLDVKLYCLDMREQFQRMVKDHFAESYRQGRTPNPCIRCNRYVKFQGLLDQADALGIPLVATGHYARVVYNEALDRYQILRGRDRRKDQSYVLTPLTQEQVSRLILPIGEMEKAEVRATAAEDALAIADRPDSQDICFIPDGDYASFLERYTGCTMEPGDFVDLEGRVLGRHRGQERYTSGQRRGLGISADRPLYVVRKEPDGRIVLGDEKDLYTAEVWTEAFNWVSLPPQTEPLHVTAKTRYSQTEAEAVLYPEAGGAVRAVFAQPQRAVTPGQTLAVYQGEVLVGGGVICGSR